MNDITKNNFIYCISVKKLTGRICFNFGLFNFKCTTLIFTFEFNVGVIWNRKQITPDNFLLKKASKQILTILEKKR